MCVCMADHQADMIGATTQLLHCAKYLSTSVLAIHFICCTWFFMACDGRHLCTVANIRSCRNHTWIKPVSGRPLGMCIRNLHTLTIAYFFVSKMAGLLSRIQTILLYIVKHFRIVSLLPKTSKSYTDDVLDFEN